MGDPTAEPLRGKAHDAICKLALKKLGAEEADLRDRYKHLNFGMQHKNLSNCIRHLVK